MAASPHGAGPPGKPGVLSISCLISPQKATLPADLVHKWGLHRLPARPPGSAASPPPFPANLLSKHLTILLPSAWITP